jgi:hypothetical protein
MQRREFLLMSLTCPVTPSTADGYLWYCPECGVFPDVTTSTSTDHLGKV